MKKLSFFALVAAGLLFGACSSDKEDISNPSGPVVFTDGAYIGVSIQLPSQTSPATRANEDFNEGSADEYAVKDATLYIFSGSSEADAAFVASYSITDDPAEDGADNSNVEATMTKATKIDNAVATTIKNAGSEVHYYAYVLINNNSQVGEVLPGTPFSTFKMQEFNNIGATIGTATIGSGGLLMTNSPVSVAAGGSAAAPTTAANYTTLVEINKANIFPTADAAEASPAACVYVERAAAKVKVSATATTGTVGTVAYTINGWQIINYEPTYYNTRQVDETWGDYCTQLGDADPELSTTFTLYNGVKTNNKYRFVSYKAFEPVGSGHTTAPYRTFFAKDPQYNAPATLTKTSATGDWLALDGNAYVTENTFNVANQTWQNTTQVAIKATFNGGAPFYMVTGSDAIYKSASKDYSSEKGAYYTETREAAQDKLDQLINNLPAVQTAISTAISDQITAQSYDAATEWTGTVKVTLPAVSDASDAGVQTVESWTVELTKNAGDAPVAADVTAVTTAITSAVTTALSQFKADFYKLGAAYYNVRIQHFGDYETPWSATKPFETVAPGTTVAQIYGADPDASKNFLGRYGIVRDNWYQLSVTGVSKIGTSTPVDVSGKTNPDDEISNYISVHVHILPWVIRNQNVVL